MLTPVILCGGSGTRLWPLSRSRMPKQLLAMHDQHTMLQATAQRLSGFAQSSTTAPIVVCNDSHRFVTRRQLLEIGFRDAQLLAEPLGRNTAPALTIAALHAQSLAPDADPTLLVMPADHVITDVAAFQEAVAIALRVTGDNAAGDAIVTFGIVPTEPATGYGYLKVGATSAFDPAAFALERFVEKPPLAQARAYVASGDYLWNSGLFVVRASVWLRALAALEPAMLTACRAALANGRRAGEDLIADATAFAASPANSIDYAVMEKLAAHAELKVRGVVVPLEAGWSDIGAWDTAWAIADKDDQGNAAIGEAIFESTRNTYVRSTGAHAPLVACVGVDDLVIVQTPDALLVASRERAQDVKLITQALAERNDNRAELHRKVYRPWGWYDSLGAGPDGAGFQVKQIAVYPGQSLSLQKHRRRAEHWVVTVGTATITIDDSVRDYQPGEHAFIPLGAVHRLENRTEAPVEIIEVQMGDYLGEDDIIRLEDRYQRS